MSNGRRAIAQHAQLWLFAATMFVGAALLFWVQPLFTKMVLPLLGGSPSVWNTAMVFFQAALLCGYGYAHLLTRHLGPRSQCLAHLCVLGAAAVALPIGIAEGWRPDSDAPPALWLLGLLFVSIGAPFFAVATTAPLIQRWFSRTGHPHASDPYFLYAASNLGSVAVLLAFPFVIEPLVGTRGQAFAWMLGFGALAACIVACGASVWRSSTSTRLAIPSSDAARPTWRRRASWLAYSAVPSALLLGVTGHISTDIASAPLLWIAPLTLYLLSFVNAFARRPLIPSWLAVRSMAFALVILAALFPWREPASIFLPLHLVVFFFIATACHAALAERRPAAEFLTEFYLFVSCGGLLGGLFVALLAPMVFDSVLEYPLSLVLAAALLPNRTREASAMRSAGGGSSRAAAGRGILWRERDIVLAILILAVLVGGRWFVSWAGLPLPFIVFASALGVFAVLVLSRQSSPGRVRAVYRGALDRGTTTMDQRRHDLARAKFLRRVPDRRSRRPADAQPDARHDQSWGPVDDGRRFHRADQLLHPGKSPSPTSSPRPRPGRTASVSDWSDSGPAPSPTIDVPKTRGATSRSIR